VVDEAAVLELRDVTVRISGLTILDGVSLSVPQGHVVGLIGPNGAGKTTIFNVISGFVRPEAGQIRYRGVDAGRIKAHRLTRMGISRTLQGVGLFPSLTGVENVMQGVGARSLGGVVWEALAMPWVDSASERARSRALEVMAELGVADQAERYPAEMPYPIQKRVALARALVSDPQVLLLDEPAGGIGADDMHDLGRLIRASTPHRTVLLVEHHMELVMEVCDLIWVLDAGRVIATGTPEQIRSDPAVLAAYLGDDGAA
jgi:branched-chain amino acid transport system ATP-binding protein